MCFHNLDIGIYLFKIVFCWSRAHVLWGNCRTFAAFPESHSSFSVITVGLWRGFVSWVTWGDSGDIWWGLQLNRFPPPPPPPPQPGYCSLCREICARRTRVMTSGQIPLDPRPLLPSLQASAKVRSATPVIETCRAWLERHSSLRCMRTSVGFSEVSV